MGVQQIVAYGDADQDGIEEQLASFAVVVDDTTGVAVGVPEIPVVLASQLALMRNPVRAGEAEMRLTLAKPDWCEVAVFDAAGRRIRQLVSGFTDAGVSRVFWDGTDARGSSVHSGVYFVRMRLRGSGQVSSKTLVMLR
jgi:hypothetical protein